MREITADRSALRKCRNVVSAGVLSPISSAVGRNGAGGDKESARAGARNSPCAAAADNSEGRGWCAGRVAIIKSRQSRPEGGFGWWRLTPPGYGGTCLPAGRSAGLTGHRPVIQYREPPQGEGFFRPGALLLALFISFWQCRSGPSGTGATGRRRGLRRGRRSWGPRWAAPRAGRSSSRRFGVFPPTWPADAGDASPAY